MDWLRTLPGRIASLVITNLLLIVVLVPIALRVHGSDGALVVTIAFGICLLANLPSLLLGDHFRSSQKAIYQVALSWGFRMGLPLTVCAIVAYQRNWLFEAGLVYYLMAFYFAMLLLETLGQVTALQAQQNKPVEAK